MQKGLTKLIYVTLVRLPTGRAHGYAIMKMCEQFAHLGHRVELVVPEKHHGLQDNPFEHYNINRNFTLRKLWATDILGKIESTSIPYFIDIATFLFSLRKERFEADSILYTRDYQVALFARSKHIFLEVHSIP